MLSGLSSAQHQWDMVDARAEGAVTGRDGWAASPFGKGEQIFDEEDRVRAVHPVYVIPQHSVDEAQEYYMSKPGF